MIAAQLPLGVGLRDTSVFESYYAGRNQPVVDALLALCVHRPPICTWLHGPHGCGKTHLLQACCVRFSQRGESTAYVPLRELHADAGLLAGYGQLALVAIDDVDQVAGDAEWERALFRLYRELEEAGGRLLVCGRAAPASSGFRLADLASRLSAGLVFGLRALDESEQARALQLRAQLRGFELPEETIAFLQRRLPRDMTRLSAFLDQLDAASLAAQRKLTVPFVKSVLEAQK